MEDKTSTFLIIGAVVAVVVFLLWKKGAAGVGDGTPGQDNSVRGPVTRGAPPVVPVALAHPGAAGLLGGRPDPVPVTTVGGAPRPLLVPVSPVRRVAF